MKQLLSFFVILFYAGSAFADNNPQSPPVTDANVFGHIINAETGEHVPFINIIVEGTRIGTITDATGHYLLTNLAPGSHRLVVQGMGYVTTFKEFEATKDRTIEVDVEVLPSAIDLAEVVITSSPTGSGFRYQPNQAYFGEALQRRGESSFGEMLNTEPGVSMRSMGSAPARPVIRGLDGDRILILQNGERMGDISETSADHSISLDPLAASRVEVVRGPASLLYGSSALGGVINLITTDIPQDWDRGFTGVLSVQGATVNDMGAGFGRIAYGGDSWASSARFSFRQAGDMRTPEMVVPGTSMRNYDGSIGAGFQGDNGFGGFAASFANQTYGVPEDVFADDERIEIRMQRQSLQGNLFRKREGWIDRAQVRFNAARLFQQEFEMEMDDEGKWDEEMELEYDKITFSSTVTLQHRPTGVFDRGAIGFNLYGHSMDVGGDEAYTPGENRFSLAAFTFQEMPITNRIRLQAGIRLDFQRTTAISNDLFPNVDQTRNAFNYSGSMGLNYRPAEGWEIGAQFARSHRNPSIEELFANGPHLGAGVFEVGDANLKDEIGNGGDLFVNYSNDVFSFEMTGFINHFLNFIIFQPTGLTDEASGYPVFRYEGDEAQMLGGELSLGYQPTSSFNITTGLDYVYGRRVGNGSENLPFIPPFRASLSMEYDFGSVWIGGRLQAVATQDQVAPEEESTDGYTVVGLQAGYRMDRGGRHVVILRGDNVFDVAYRDHLSRIEDRNVSMPGRNIHLAYRWYF